MTSIIINDFELNALLDTGASCSIIKESIARRLDCHLEPCYVKITGVGQGALTTLAKISVPVRFENVALQLELYVVKDNDFNFDCIIGANAVQYPDVAIVSNCMRTTIVQVPPSSIDFKKPVINSIEVGEPDLSSFINHLDRNLQKQIKDIFLKYPSVISSENIGTVQTGELTIRLKKDEIVNYRPYRLAPIEREKCKQILDDLLQRKIIRESNSPYASPVILVKKKDGTDRMCIDYRALNKNIERERYPLPLIEDQIDKLGRAKYFISIDMKNGFYQIPVSPNSIKYTAFITPDGHYEFLKMPFGICNGPSVFQKAISKAIQHLDFAQVYIDDLLIPFMTISEGLKYLDLTLQALNQAGFTINLRKCKFFVTSIEYLGRRISGGCVQPSESKISALINSPVPSNVKEVRQFMGLASYFRKFIPNFASRTACITKLTKNNQKWEWGTEQNDARSYVIKHLVTKPLLTIFDPSLPTELHTDASAIGYGAILLQKYNGDNRVVAYFSKRTSPTESRYHSYDLETLAIYNALKHFRVYLLGINFKIITDCNAIKMTMNKKDLSPRIARWWTYLQDFSFEIVYRKGKYISHVDYLSRNPEVIVQSIPRQTVSVNIVTDHDSWLEIAQTRCTETQALIEKLQSGELDENHYVLKNNLLYYRVNTNSSPKLYVPKGSRFNILRLYHDENCHVGYDKTLAKILESFWFPGIAKFVKKYISHCLVCTEHKSHSGPKQGLLHPIHKEPLPFHTVHLDCTGPFGTSTEGYKYVLIIVDGFTKFCILRPLKSMTGWELVETVRDALSIFGSPTNIITDRGTNFSSRQMQSLFNDWQARHHMVATGTPRGNGQVERYVATITNMLSTACRNLAEWPSNLWKVQQSLNTTVQKSTGFSPLRLLIGRDCNVPPIQARLDEIPSIPNIIDVRSDRELAYRRLCNLGIKFKSRFDAARRNNIDYKVGDVVYVNQEHRRNDKLKPKYKGPYEIIRILENDRFYLKGRGNLREIIVAKEKLRLWPGD